MKIGIDARCLMGRNYSGVPFYTLNLLRALFDQDSENEYVLFYNSSKNLDLPEFDYPNVSYRGFRYPNKIFNICLRLFQYPKIDRIVGSVDVFFIPNPNFFAFSHGCKKVFTIHDLSFIRFPKFFTLKMRLWHRFVSLPRIVSSADAIIAVSDHTKRDIVDILNVDEKKIMRIYEGIDDKFRVLPLDDNQLKLVRDKYGLPKKYILFIGALEPRKNIEGVIRAFNKLDSDLELVIGGASGWSNKNQIKLAKDNPKIHFIGYVDELDKVAIYNLADLFVYASYYEGFGLPILEAMACGCPVICGNNSSQVEVAGDAAILVNAYDAQEILTAMSSLLSSEDLRNLLIERGLNKCKQFRWQTNAEQVLRLFNNITREQ